ncbi:WecB/TagA/CpsF family glycosyltransferase [Rivularia sp. UHCC 0363]|uniref:WecB/TagA/CpsF family glycosyltransferase n=1 Tax=Rivularia sp. UHCC 0363 TaxID=3110244 RepID=UPI002B206062|nr:WecB/TagA/CpsF family glycosyltransferase [Rivularia sp. UHCC 0363]MEA5597807.1 WecB/TagA/CpsF family glycosyltransferase [Rivularia sp. UHCC 0363]
MIKPPKVFSVLGLPIHLTTNYPGYLLQRLQQRMGTHVVTLNAEMTMQAERNETLATIIKAADLVIPDGAGIVLYLRLLLKQDVRRIPGIELAEALLREIGQNAPDSTVFFYGGKPGTAAAAAQFWQKQLPNLNVVGTHSGYHSPEEEQKLHSTLSQLQPQVIYVGLGVPRQELWIEQNRHLCPQATWIGVGGSFDIWSGTKTRAPAWLGDNNLEWLYRLYQEPWRWRRMLALPQFAWKALIYGVKTKGA